MAAVQVFPIFIPHAGCPFRCVFCDQAAITGATLEGRPDVDRLRYWRLTLEQFVRRYHFQDKEVAFFGGTFTAMSEDTREFWFGLVSPVIDRRTTIRISTRPDYVEKAELSHCMKRGVRTIELGVQSFDDHALNESLRGYTGQTAEDGCRRVLESGFKLGIQLMPGLPGDTLERFLASIDRTISIRPSFVRLYPAIVLTGTEMERWYNEGQYRPWSLEEAVEACDLAVERLTAGGINIAKVGLHSDIPQGHIVAGPFHHNLGELVRARGMFRHVEDSPEANRALIVSGYDVSLLKGAPGRYYDTYRERYGDIPIYIDRNMPKSRFLVVNSDSQETRNLGLFR